MEREKGIWKKQIIDLCIIFLILFGFSLVISLISMYYSTGNYGMEMFLSYLQYKKLIFFHFLPVFSIAATLYFISNCLSAACGITGFLILILTWINYFKLQFRDDPFLFKDILIAAEAKNMSEHYEVRLTSGMVFCILAMISLTILLHFCKIKVVLPKLRLILLFTCVLVSAGFYKKIYCSRELYEGIENYGLVNRWGETQRFISRGFLYPFIYSISDAFPQKPEGYDRRQMKELADSYVYEDIPDQRKVNIIGIMMEAYNDFSKFEELEFISNPYEKLHNIQDEGYAGELITNIFAGGTINTERAFLSGYTYIPDMRARTNTWVQYFKDQGYVTTGRHQCYGWFYNRKNINRNMGFDEYEYYEEGYSDYDIYMLKKSGDSILINDIISDYKEITSKGDKCFSFSVTYQNHGPYSVGNEYKAAYLKRKDSYTDEEYNIINNYLEGIAATGDAIEELIEFLREDKEPVVVILFGDHNPWLGDGNSVYNMLGINLDLGTEEGFYNYYNTPYIFWANEEAENILDTQFKGKGDNISACFLMNEFFKQAGYVGNEYMQYAAQIYEKMPVITSSAYIENGEFVRTLSEEGKSKAQEFNRMQYYWIHDKKLD